MLEPLQRGAKDTPTRIFGGHQYLVTAVRHTESRPDCRLIGAQVGHVENPAERPHVRHNLLGQVAGVQRSRPIAGDAAERPREVWLTQPLTFPRLDEHAARLGKRERTLALLEHLLAARARKMDACFGGANRRRQQVGPG